MSTTKTQKKTKSKKQKKLATRKKRIETFKRNRWYMGFSLCEEKKSKKKDKKTDEVVNSNELKVRFREQEFRVRLAIIEAPEKTSEDHKKYKRGIKRLLKGSFSVFVRNVNDNNIPNVDIIHGSGTHPKRPWDSPNRWLQATLLKAQIVKRAPDNNTESQRVIDIHLSKFKKNQEKKKRKEQNDLQEQEKKRKKNLKNSNSNLDSDNSLSESDSQSESESEKEKEKGKGKRKQN